MIETLRPRMETPGCEHVGLKLAIVRAEERTQQLERWRATVHGSTVLNCVPGLHEYLERAAYQALRYQHQLQACLRRIEGAPGQPGLPDLSRTRREAVVIPFTGSRV